MLILNQADFYLQAEAFVRLAHNSTMAIAHDLRDCYIDHVCYRVQSQLEYAQCKELLGGFAQLLTETPVNGRLIATYRLAAPIVLDHMKIHLVELPAPKAGSDYCTGFEHVEYVIPTSFEYFVKLNPMLRTNHEIVWKDYNPEMRVHLSQCNIKFHYAPLDEVVRLEQLPLEKRRLVVFDLHGTLADPENRRGGICRIYPEARELVEKFKAQNIPMVVWTSCDLETTHELLQNWGLDVTFERLWTLDAFPAKPEVSGLQYLTGARPSKLVDYYGDTRTDQNAALQLGYNFHWATWNPRVTGK